MPVSVVQVATPAGVTATTATATFAAPVTAGNTICASVAVYDGSTSAFTVALTLGSSPDHWVLHRKAARSAAHQNSYAAAWADADCLGGQTAVTVTLSGATGGFFTGLIVEAYEVAGLPAAAEDITGATSGSLAAFTTGSFTPSATSSAADEFWWGVVAVSGSPGITGPAGWVNTAVLSSGTAATSAMAGYQCTTAAGTPVYSGTLGSDEQWTCAGATLRAGGTTGTASLSGGGALAGSGGPEASAAMAGDGEVTAAGTAAPPGSAFPAGSGTLAATAALDITATAAMAGDGEIRAAGNPPVTVGVVNQWAGTIAQNPAFGPSLPALASAVVALTPAASVGGGSGVPTQGNWLFAICGWRQAPGAAPVTLSSVGDDTHAWWRPAPPSPAAGLTRTAIWYQPNIGAVTTVPAFVYVAPSGYVPGMAVLIIEVAGLGPWDFATGMAVSYLASTRTLSLSVTL